MSTTLTVGGGRDLCSRARRLGRQPAYTLFRLIQLAYQLMGGASRRSIRVFVGDADNAARSELEQRFRYFVGNKSMPVHPWPASGKLPWRILLSEEAVLLFGVPEVRPAWAAKHRRGVLDVDFRTNPADGWSWHALLSYQAGRQEEELTASRRRFERRLAALRNLGLKKVYLFGTGPSLEKARDRDWSDGYRIVCNTIVRDPSLWRHLQPHFIVAADAIYHFGHTAFAQAFRRDLTARLDETDTSLVYSAVFHPFVSRTLSRHGDRLIPVPGGPHEEIHRDLAAEFAVPSLGNVLPHLLLPLGCSLSRNVCLFGFDGRAPTDRLFWANSSRHSYPQLMPELQRAHPRFFDHHVPAVAPDRYVRTVHGDVLERCLSRAEQAGWRFTMMHPSWTPTLQKRCHLPAPTA